MKKILRFLSVLLIIFLVKCSNDDLASSQFLDAERGAVLRTVEFRSTEFRTNDPSSTIDILVEEQDVENGDLLDFVQVFIAFQDNTPEGTDLSTSEILFDTVDSDAFVPEGNIIPPSNQPLPRTVLNYTFSEMMDALGIPISAASCADQILVRTELFLTNDSSFSVESLSSLIAGFGTFFSSSFCYDINIIEPMEPELFTGTYFYESILDGFFGPTFGAPQLVEVERSHSENVRVINFGGIPFEFTIACDRVLVQKLQFPGVPPLRCGFSGTVLYGPDEVSAPVNIEDDSVFEVWFVEGDNGFDGGCDFGTVPSRFRLSRQ